MPSTTLLWPAADDAHLARADGAARGFDAFHGAIGVAADAGHFAILDDVDAERVRRAGVAPGHGVVARRAAAALQGRAHHGIADVIADVQRRAIGLGFFRRQPLVVHAVGAVGMNVALEHLHVVHGVRQHHDAARREHDVVVQHLRQRLPTA